MVLPLVGVTTTVRLLSVFLLILLAPFTKAALGLNDLVKLGSVDRVAALLAEGSFASPRDNIGWTPLHNAANSGNVELVKLLLEYHAKINAKDTHYERTALHLATYNGEKEVIKTLLNAGAATNVTDINGQTALHLATWNGHLGATLILLNHGADINAQDKYGSTPVRLAAIQKFANIIKVLLLFCPDLRLLDIKGVTVVEFVKKKEQEDIISIFEEHHRTPCSRYKLQSVARRVHLSHNGEKCERGENHFPDVQIPYRWRLQDIEAGETLVIPCPSGTNGTATWTCGLDGWWHRTPNLSKCHSLLFNGWQEVLATDNNITAAEIITTIANSLRDTRRTITLAPGDLITIGGILEKLQNRHIQDLKRMTSGIKAWKLAMKYLDGTMESVDIMLTKPALWWGLDQQSRDTTFTQLQNSVTFATNSLATRQMDSTQEFSVNSLSTRVMHRSVSYFKSILLTYTHPHFNQTTLALPIHFYNTYQAHQDNIQVIFVSYKDLHCTVNTLPCSPDEVVADRDLPAEGQVNSAIIGANIGGGSTWHAPLGEIVTIRLQHVYSGDKYLLGERTCVWWDRTSNSWATDGCHLVYTTNHFSLCHCDHLTNLAVIMDINGVLDNTNVMYRVMKCITIVGCVVSIVSLALCVVCFVAFKDIRENTRSIIHANLCLCLMISEMVLLGGLDATHNKLICTIVAAVLHYFFLSTFTWSAIEAFHMYLNFVKVFKTKVSPLKYYMMVGYFIPLMYVTLTLVFTQAQGYSSNKVCWLSPQGLIWSFAGPLAVILLFNTSIFLMTMYVAWCKERPQPTTDYHKTSSTHSSKSRDKDNTLWKNLTAEQHKLSSAKRKHSSSTSSSSVQKFSGNTSAKGGLHPAADGGSSNHHSLRRRIGGSLSVLLLLCLTWLSGFLYFLDGSHVLALIFTLLNSMQGVGIFLLHIVMNPRIMREVKRVLK